MGGYLDVDMDVNMSVATDVDGNMDKVMNVDNKDLIIWVFFSHEDWRKQPLPLASGL